MDVDDTMIVLEAGVVIEVHQLVEEGAHAKIVVVITCAPAIVASCRIASTPRTRLSSL